MVGIRRVEKRGSALIDDCCCNSDATSRIAVNGCSLRLKIKSLGKRSALSPVGVSFDCERGPHN